MKNTINKLVSKILELITGTGFFGIALVIYALLSWIFIKGYAGNALAWAFIGAFIGKNTQSIKASIKTGEGPDPNKEEK